MGPYRNGNTPYRRYHIETENAPEIAPWPSRFKVQVSRPALAKYLLSELIEYRGDKDTILSRPCVYGVFSAPLGGFTPREQLCVGCLRCTTEHPDMVQILPNPERLQLGDSYFTSNFIDAIAYEAATGSIPVKGAGYRGRFGGEGWDGMWTDMSEIVRPTRDGIHGREYISTSVDIGAKPSFLTFDSRGIPHSELPQTVSLPIPFIFDAPPNTNRTKLLALILAEAARQTQSLAVLPLETIQAYGLSGPHTVPLAGPSDQEALNGLSSPPRLLALDGWDRNLYQWLKVRFPRCLIILRSPFPSAEDLLAGYEAGVRTSHLVADFHGRGRGNGFIHDLIRDAHGAFVSARVRDEVTLIAGGGMIAAEHVPKGIIAGADAISLDTAALVALQANFPGESAGRETSTFGLPDNLTAPWGVQRLKNLSAAWRDQLLEVLGAMGLREVRRLRGEVGRVMYMKDLEKEAFAEIEGYYG